MNEGLSELHAALDKALENVGASLGKPDWQYRDLPRLSHDLMAEFKMVAGEENLQWLTWADYGTSVRGQVIISPEGMKRLKEYVDRAEQ